MPYRKYLPRPFGACLAGIVRLTHRVKYRTRFGSYENFVKSLNNFNHPKKFRRVLGQNDRKTRRASIRSLRARIHQRLCRPSDTIVRANSSKHKRINRICSNNITKTRRAWSRSIGPGVRQRTCSPSEDLEKVITQSDIEGIWMGSQDDPQVLKEMNITRVIHLDRKTIVLQPHEDRATNHIPQLSFYEAYDYDRDDILKDLEALCRIIHVELLLDKQVLIYVSQAPSKEESSRVRTLILAYRIYTGYIELCYNYMLENRKTKAFKGLKKTHFEQLLVWTLLTEQSEAWRRQVVYNWWSSDLKGKSTRIRRTREWKRGYLEFRRGFVYLNGTRTKCLVM